MSRIVALSKWGFKLDKLSNEWTQVDESLLKRDIFTTLKKGDNIQITKKNREGFILDFKIIPQDVEENINKLTSLNDKKIVNSKSSSLPIVNGVDILERDGSDLIHSPNVIISKPSVQDNIRYGQALNIAFENQSISGLNLCSKDKDWVQNRIDECLDIADIIYNRMSKRCLR